MDSLTRISEIVIAIAGNLGQLIFELVQLGVNWALVLVWLAWWLAAVNWTKLWPVLRKGAWMPLVLLCILAALVWSRLAPGAAGGWPVFWGHLAAVACLAVSALVCGWLQGLFHWAPAEINLNPPAHGHGHDHGHGHH